MKKKLSRAAKIWISILSVVLLIVMLPFSYYTFPLGFKGYTEPIGRDCLEFQFPDIRRNGFEYNGKNYRVRASSYRDENFTDRDTTLMINATEVEVRCDGELIGRLKKGSLFLGGIYKYEYKLCNFFYYDGAIYYEIFHVVNRPYVSHWKFDSKRTTHKFDLESAKNYNVDIEDYKIIAYEVAKPYHSDYANET